MDPAIWAQLKDYNRPDFHPDDSDTTELVETWRAELFGEHGTLNDKLIERQPDGRDPRRDAPRRPRRRRRTLRHRRRRLPAGASAPGRPTPSSRRATPSAGRGTSSATPASAPTPTCTPWATPSAPGTARSPSPTATPSCSTSRTPLARPASTPTSASATASSRPTGRAPTPRWHVTAVRSDTRSSVEETVQVTAASSSPAAATTATTTATCPTSPAWTTSAARSCTRRTGPENLDYAGKRVVVIGSGATAVTLVPALARSAAHVTMLQRSPTYIASLPEKSPVVHLLRKLLPPAQAGTAAKWFNALLTQVFYQVSRRYPGAVKRMLRKGLERQLPPGYDIDTHFTPRYDPWDQRFCAVPDGDLFKAIAAGSVSVVTDTHRALHREGPAAHLGHRARGGHHRHRHRARAALPRGHEVRVDGEEVVPSIAPHLQGDDARRRAQPGRRHRLHQRIVDAQVRPHL